VRCGLRVLLGASAAEALGPQRSESSQRESRSSVGIDDFGLAKASVSRLLLGTAEQQPR
jgi:hypothetical protein